MAGETEEPRFEMQLGTQTSTAPGLRTPRQGPAWGEGWRLRTGISQPHPPLLLLSPAQEFKKNKTWPWVPLGRAGPHTKR